ncbi:MAG TPA: GDSL-type esterase/lipase family protein [Planctomycetota bacterium]|nr:GDSL-type esterase/lipase family protein [Planctomycetota bacterium]
MRARRPVAILFALAFAGALAAQKQAPPPAIRWIDLDGDEARQTTVYRVPNRYQGHPTTVLLADGHTMLCVHPEGHGKGPIVLQRSEDGGRTWSAPLPVPENWATSQETPTMHRLVDRAGKERLVLFSGLYPIRSSLSEDDGTTWTPLEPIGHFGGIVAMASVVRLKNGDHAAFFHDDGRYLREGGKRSQFSVYETRSQDGGLTWGEPTVVWTGAGIDLCEPGVVRSPDGKRLAMLLRENARKLSSHVMFSDDEAATWSNPVELPQSLCGDRHTCAYGPDGRLLVSFRDMAKDSPTRGDWVAWVGTFADLVAGREGQYRVRLSRNWRGTDCGYPGVEVLPDGTFVLVTYGHWEPGEAPFVRAVRLRLEDLDALSKGPAPSFSREPGTVRPTARPDTWWVERVAADLTAARAGGHDVVFVGDSITEGWNAAGKPCWQEFWAPRHALNLGVSGDRTQNVLWRLDHGQLQALADNNDVRAVVVMIGTDNSNGDECSAEDIAIGMQTVVNRLRAALPKAGVLLLAIFPRGEKPDEQRAKCKRASELAAAAFGGDPRVVYRDIGDRFVGENGVISKDVMEDFLHPTAAGYRTWAEAIVGDVDAMRTR